MGILGNIGRGFGIAGRGLLGIVDRGTNTALAGLPSQIYDPAAPTTSRERAGMRGQFLMNLGQGFSNGSPAAGSMQFRDRFTEQRMMQRQLGTQEQVQRSIGAILGDQSLSTPQRYRAMSDVFTRIGDSTSAQRYGNLANQMEEQDAKNVQNAKPNYLTPQPMYVSTGNPDGSTQRILGSVDSTSGKVVNVGGGVPVTKIVSLGNRVALVDEQTGEVIQSWLNGVNPDTANTNAARQALQDSQTYPFPTAEGTPAMLVNNAGTTTLVRGPDGHVVLTRNENPPPLNLQVVTGKNNQLLKFNPRTGAVSPTGVGGKPLRVPPSMVKAFNESAQTEANVDSALAELTKYPSGVGLASMMPDAVNQRWDPDGVALRAAIVKVSSQVLHDLSGAAVTVGEDERTKPYIPKVTDTPATVRIKLMKIRQIAEQMKANIQGQYPIDEGWQPLSTGEGGGGGNNSFTVLENLIKGMSDGR